MSLNVKDPEAHRLAQAIAQATGQSMTRVVTEALRERFARIERQKSKASVAELLTIADRAATHVKRPYVDHAELFYDDNGLPKCSSTPRPWSRSSIATPKRRPSHKPSMMPMPAARSEEHTSELQSLMRTSYAVFGLKK